MKNKYRFYKLIENIKYRKYKDCNLYYPLDNEYVSYNGDYNIEKSLVYALPKRGLIYHYNLGDNLMHTHDFEGVLYSLYMNPESFEISEEGINEYSKQELDFIKENKNYLNLFNLKDYHYCKELCELNNKYDELYKKKNKNIKDKLFLKKYNKKFYKLYKKDLLKRYNNVKHLEYMKYYTLYWNNEVVDASLNGNKKTCVYLDDINRIGNKCLIVDDDCNYRFAIEYVKFNKIKFEDLNDNMVYVSKKYKNFKEYKNDIKKSFSDYKELNDEDTIQLYEFKIIEIFK